MAVYKHYAAPSAIRACLLTRHIIHDTKEMQSKFRNSQRPNRTLTNLISPKGIQSDHSCEAHHKAFGYSLLRFLFASLFLAHHQRIRKPGEFHHLAYLVLHLIILRNKLAKACPILRTNSTPHPSQSHGL